MKAALSLKFGTELRQIVASHFHGFTWESTSGVRRTESRERHRTGRDAMSKREIPVPVVNRSKEILRVFDLVRLLYFMCYKSARTSADRLKI
jgi:hypothetical protein